MANAKQCPQCGTNLSRIKNDRKRMPYLKCAFCKHEESTPETAKEKSIRLGWHDAKIGILKTNVILK